MPVSLSVLVAHPDAAESQLIQSLLRAAGIQGETAAEGKRALQFITRRKFDGIFVGEGLANVDSLELIRCIRKSPSNKRAPVVFIANAESDIKMDAAFKAGAMFYVARPLNEKKVTRLLSATRGSLLAERRKYYRAATAVPVSFKAGSKTGQMQCVNVSLSGILLEARGKLQVGEAVELEFKLPGQDRAIRAPGAVVRVDAQQRAGIKFGKLEAAEHERLEKFIQV